MRQLGNNLVASVSRWGDIGRLFYAGPMQSARRGWTLLELLTTIVIFSILVSGLAIGGRTVYNSRQSAAAKQQIAQISNAIEQYASSWPAWKIPGITIAARGWPDFVPGRVFGSCTNVVGPYNQIAGFNDVVDLTGPDWIDNLTLAMNSSTCLAYELTSSSGKGPYLMDRQGANLVDAKTLTSSAANILYPSFCTAGSGARPAEVFVDPWGTPIRFFWVYRDAAGTAYRGYLPVDFGPVLADASAFGSLNARFKQSDGVHLQIADGFVLESAGPNKKFGNVWKRNPTPAEIEDAEDNLIISP